MKFKKRKAIYCRTATDESMSVEKQINKCLSVMGSKKLGLISVFADIRTSGLSRRRIGLNALLQGAESGHISKVYVSDANRISRDVKYFQSMKAYLAMNRVELICVK